MNNLPSFAVAPFSMLMYDGIDSYFLTNESMTKQEFEDLKKEILKKIEGD